MSLSVHEALRHVGSTLGDSDVETEVDPLEILNVAGVILFSMNEWSFLQQVQVSVDMVSGQDYMALPVDCKSVRHIQHANGLVASVMLVTLGELLERRTQSLGGTRNFWAAVEWAPNTDGIPEARLGIWPTPSDDSAGIVEMYYDRAWVDIEDDVGYIPIPNHIKPLYVQILRAVARGYEEEDEGSLDVRLSGIRQGPVFLAAKRHDNRTQVEFGPLRNGVGDSGAGWGNPWYAQSNASGPS